MRKVSYMKPTREECEQEEGAMDELSEEEKGYNRFIQVITAAAQLPGIRVDREKYLRGALKGKYSPAVIGLAVGTSPANAGIPSDELGKIADASIRFEAMKVTALSSAAGLPGGFAMAATIPADITQYFGHVLRIVQKLSYLYGWESLFDDNDDEVDDEAKINIVLFLGVMFGAQGAAGAVAQIAEKTAQTVAKQLPKQALTKTFYYPIAKKVATFLGIQMNKEIFGKGVAKAVPVLGALVSGGITFAAFVPMSFKLKDYLATLPTADPGIFIEKEASDIIEIEPILTKDDE